MKKVNSLHKPAITVALISFIIGFVSLLVIVQILESHAKKQADLDIERDMRVAWDQLGDMGNKFHIKNDLLYVDEQLLSGRLDIVDKITELVGGTATIFQGDLRIATSIKLPDGKRATGTKLEKNEAYKRIFQDRKPFRGYVDILGVNYVTAYDPIFDHEGSVIGIIYVGREIEDYFSPIYEIEFNIALIVFVSVLFGTFLTFLSSRIVISKTHIDSLTGAVNRKVGEEVLEESLTRAIGSKSPLSIAFVDLDDFKSVNDKFGHSVGDEVLQSISQVLKHIGRKSDYVVRWGGDEFLMVFEGASKKQAFEILRRIVEDQSLLPKLPDGSNQTLSIGLTAYDAHNESIKIEELITAADYMMYQSKNSGKNQISM